MASRSAVFGIIAKGKDAVSPEMKKAAKSIVSAQRSAAQSARRLTTAEKLKAKALRASAAAFRAGKTAALAAGAAFAGAAAGVVALAVKSANAGDAAFIMADRLNVTTEFLTRMQFAATQTGASAESLEKAIGTLSKNALAGTKQFDRWGVAVRDSNGELLDGEGIFRSAIERFGELGSSTERLAFAQEVFGKSGRELVPFLEQGEAGLAAMSARADELGITISTSSAIIANEFNNQLGATRDALDGLTRTAGSVFLPVFTRALVGVQKETATWNKEIGENSDGIQNLAQRVLVGLVRGLAGAVRAGGFLVQAFQGIRVVGQVVLQTLVSGFVKLAKFALLPLRGIEKMMAALQKIGAINVNPLAGVADQMSATLDTVNASIADVTNEAIASMGHRQTLIDAAADRLDRFAVTLGTVTDAEVRAAQKTASAKSESEAQKRSDVLQTAAAEREAAAQKRAADRLAKEKIREEQKTARARLAEQQAGEKEALASLAESAQETADRWKQVGAAITGSIAGMISKSQSFGQTIKGLFKTGLSIAGSLVGGAIGGPGGAIAGQGLAQVGGAFVDRFQIGGIAQGPPGRPMPAVIEGGEGVLPVRLTQQLRRVLAVAPGPQAATQGGGGGGIGALNVPINLPASGSFPSASDLDRSVRDSLLPVIKRLMLEGELGGL